MPKIKLRAVLVIKFLNVGLTIHVVGYDSCEKSAFLHDVIESYIVIKLSRFIRQTQLKMSCGVFNFPGSLLHPFRGVRNHHHDCLIVERLTSHQV